MASSSIVMGLTALVFCTWTVSMAGLASLQEECDPGFSYLPCYRVYRYQWWIICLEFVLIAGLGIALATGAYAKTRLSWLAMFTVATVLYINITDTANTMLNNYESAEGQMKHRVRTMLAGTIMTSAVNCLLIIALGIAPEEESAANGAEPTVVAEKSAV